MILFNLFGNWRWLPEVKAKRERETWFLSVAWLGLVVTLYSRDMAAHLIEAVNASARRMRRSQEGGQQG